ncbi:MAG: hypothetical protein IJX70_02045 [Clostridia bacterium]|nr:hypothetical protein [Clostridia bacterium]
MKRLLQHLYDPIFAHAPIQEIRMGLGMPVQIQTPSGTHRLSLRITKSYLEELLSVACDHSLYTACDRLVQGYLPYRGGVRIGISGAYTLQQGALGNLSQINGVVIRIPHVAPLPASIVMRRILGKSVLVVSAPGGGKTTLLRSLAAAISTQRKGVVILDERLELSGGIREEGYHLDVGESMVLLGGGRTLLYQGVIRALSPSTVVLDELMNSADWQMVHTLKSSGIEVLASLHAPTLERLPPEAAAFEVAILLSDRPTAGTVVEVRYA